MQKTLEQHLLDHGVPAEIFAAATQAGIGHGLIFQLILTYGLPIALQILSAFLHIPLPVIPIPPAPLPTGLTGGK